MLQNDTTMERSMGGDRFVGSLDEDYYSAFLRELVWDSQLPESTTDEPEFPDNRS